MHVIDTSVAIAAPPERVWEILADLPRYEEWNPFIPRAEGEVAAGKSLRLFIRPPGDKGMTHQPTVLAAEPGRRLVWLGKVAVPGLFSARHEFLLEPVSPGTVLTHREEFRGLLVPLVRDTLRRTEQGFAELNQALKERAEADGT